MEYYGLSVTLRLSKGPSPGGGGEGGYFQVIGFLGCAAGRGRIFMITNGLTLMSLHFQ